MAQYRGSRAIWGSFGAVSTSLSTRRDRAAGRQRETMGPRGVAYGYFHLEIGGFYYGDGRVGNEDYETSSPSWLSA